MTRGATRSVAIIALVAAMGGACGEPAAEPGATQAPYPSKPLTIMAPAKAGGGWDSTARALQDVLTTTRATNGHTVDVSNVAGDGGTTGLKQFVAEGNADPHRLMVTGLVMVGSISVYKSTVGLDKVTPIATLTTEYEAVTVAADSKYKTIADLMADLRTNPTAVRMAGGSKGGPDHILAGLLARQAGVEPATLSYADFSGGGELISNLIYHKVDVGVSSVSEFKEGVANGTLRVLAVSSPAPIVGVDAPTLKASGIDLELANWRGVVAPGGLSDTDRAAVLGLVQRMHDSPEWKKALQDKGWEDFYRSGDEFDTFLRQEQERVQKVLADLGV